MKIEWLGHSCFKITTNDYSICLDPYNPKMIPGIDVLEVTANLVLASHQHDDHNYFQAVSIIEKDQPQNLKISFINTFHDDHDGSIRGKNKITIIEDDEYKVAHMGDLGTELTHEQIDLLKDLDAIMIPIGGYYTIDFLTARKICYLLKPKVTIPMHYKGKKFGFDVLDTLDKFIALNEDSKITYYLDNTLTLTDKTNEHVAILKLSN